jgi:hypothetical protein
MKWKCPFIRTKCDEKVRIAELSYSINEQPMLLLPVPSEKYFAI